MLGFFFVYFVLFFFVFVPPWKKFRLYFALGKYWIIILDTEIRNIVAYIYDLMEHQMMRDFCFPSDSVTAIDLPFISLQF